MNSKTKYRLAKWTQVREEDFGLLFYTMSGPRLYFLPVKQLITPDFFEGRMTLSGWMEENNNKINRDSQLYRKIETCLDQLKEKGVILEC